MNTLISIDSSTTACKAIAWDREGNALAEGRASYPLLRPYPGWAEQNAEDWWTSACAALRACVDQIDPASVEALGITHQRESFVPVDEAGRPTRNAILWLDERSRSQVAQLESDFGRDALHRLTGKPPSMTQSLPKVLWMLQNDPDAVARAAKLVEVHAFLVHRLTGLWRTSLAGADPTGMVDMEARQWAADLIADLGLSPDLFPELVPPGSVIGHVTADAAHATGLPKGLPVVAGAGDGQCAGLGANAITPERAYLNMGTAVVSGVMSQRYEADRAFRTLYAPVPGAYFLEHVLRGGVLTVAWFVERFAADLAETRLPLSPEEALEAAAAKLPPGAQGLMLVPYWNNVMNPYWDPRASGITIGWTTAHGREHFYRAILEGVAYEQRLVGDAMMNATGARLEEYVTMGGGSRSGLWCQIVADITGVPVVRSATAEATCLGAGILAAAAVGWYPDIRAAAAGMTATHDRFTPEPERQALYHRLYTDVYRGLFPALQPLVDRLTELTDAAS
ncbi:MAG: FGGY-family carbohydrate kinase [Caldilineaceae bacterium]|nr:FGGY-family carbohydrate kinase [Caldilineaceae bacterium]